MSCGLRTFLLSTDTVGLECRLYEGHLEVLLERRLLGPPAELLIQWVWAQDSAFPSDSQVLLAWGATLRITVLLRLRPRVNLVLDPDSPAHVESIPLLFFGFTNIIFGGYMVWCMFFKRN